MELSCEPIWYLCALNVFSLISIAKALEAVMPLSGDERLIVSQLIEMTYFVPMNDMQQVPHVNGNSMLVSQATFIHPAKVTSLTLPCYLVQRFFP